MEREIISTNLNSQVYEILKEKILSREISPGTRLVDTKIAKSFGISRTPIRDALRQLTEDGLVVSIGKKGFSVFQPSQHDIEEIFELRELIDIAAVTKLIQTILPNDLSVLCEIEQSLRNREGSPNGNLFIRSDEDFHDTLVKACGNSRLVNIYSDLRSQTRIFRRKTSSNEVRKQKAEYFHQRIFDGLKNLNLDETIDAVKNHVAQSKADAINDYVNEVINDENHSSQNSMQRLQH